MVFKRKSFITLKFEINLFANLRLEELPNLNQIILGGEPFKFAKVNKITIKGYNRIVVLTSVIPYFKIRLIS